MGDRRKSRELALQVLYSMDIAPHTCDQALRLFWGAHCEEKNLDVMSFTERLVRGTREKLDSLDTKIGECSTNWKVPRMSIVDRNILRLAAFELLYCEDIPSRVTLNEAIEIAKQFGTEESGAFINGILDRIAKMTTKKEQA